MNNSKNANETWPSTGYIPGRTPVCIPVKMSKISHTDHENNEEVLRRVSMQLLRDIILERPDDRHAKRALIWTPIKESEKEEDLTQHTEGLPSERLGLEYRLDWEKCIRRGKD